MKIEINIPDEFVSSVSEGLKIVARNLNTRFKTDKSGAEFINEFFNGLWEGAHELSEVAKIKAEAREAIRQKKEEMKADKVKK